MKPWTADTREADAVVRRIMRGELDQDQLLRLCKSKPELVTLALLAASRRINGQTCWLWCFANA